jgi:hypothetical protein
MSTKIYYQNLEVLSGQPTPIVGVGETMVRYGERWAELSTVTLKGQITGCPNEFQGLLYEQQRLINVFNKDYQTLQIIEGSGVIHSKPYCIVKDGVKFDSATYNGILNYEVVLECYPEYLFSGVFGVLDPTDSWDFEEREDKTLRVSHSISARGFNTSSGASNAFQNAKSFVASKTGASGLALPYFINIPSGFGVCLRDIRETANKFEGSYGIEMVFEGDLYYNQGGLLRHTTTTECDNLNGLTRVTINGTVKGCSTDSIIDVRNRYNNFDVWGEAQSGYANFGAGGQLNSGYLSSGINEEPFTPALGFSVAFDNFTGDNTYFDYQVNVSSGESSVINVTVDGNIVGRGDIRTRWANVSGFYSNLDLLYYATGAYFDFAGFNDLNPFPLSSGVTFNQFQGTIRTSASFNDKRPPLDGFSVFDFTYDYMPSTQRVVAQPLVTDLNGPVCDYGYVITDLGYKNRCSFSIQGNGRPDCDTSLTTALNSLKAWANSGFDAYCPIRRAVLESNVITTGINNIGFSFTWTAESDNNVVIPRVDYLNINELALK